MKKVKNNNDIVVLDRRNEQILDFLQHNMKDIEESVVSLRFMNKIEAFLEENNCTKREFAKELCYSESYISQLMTGSKKVNVSFINKFEKYFNVKFDIKISNQKIQKNWEIDLVDTVTYTSFYVNIQQQTPIYFQNKISNISRSEDSIVLTKTEK